MSQGITAINEKVKKESAFVEALKLEIGKVIVGQKYLVDRLIIGILANGHILVEGVPGLAKTLSIKTLSQAVSTKFQRIQFTPDLLPADLIGTLIYNPKEGIFTTKKGPIFANIILADEINRAPAKVQSALLEAMQERQVTIGENTYKLDEPFLVMATQNPIEQEGTYPLPEAQVDRFMFKLLVDLPSPEEEIDIIRLKHKQIRQSVRRVTTPMTIVKMKETVETKIYCHEDLMDYIRDIVVATRTDPRLILGGSPRCSIALLNSAKAVAAMRGRDYVIPDDVKRIARVATAHRLQMKPEAELEGTTGTIVVNEILRNQPVPV